MHARRPSEGGCDVDQGTAGSRWFARVRPRDRTSGCARAQRRAGIPYATHIAMGPAGVRICQFAEVGGFERIVLGTKGLGWVNTVLVGSVARHVIDSSNRPILLVR
ncbi:MAG: universal stress protein [Pseudomonadota bacterium]